MSINSSPSLSAPHKPQSPATGSIHSRQSRLSIVGRFRAIVAGLLIVPSALTSATLTMPDIYPLVQYQVQLVATASWYHLPGQRTASGALYGGMTAAHRQLPFGSRVTLCRDDHPLVCATVRIVDRMGKNDPLDRQWDLSLEAARKLHMVREGLLRVVIYGAE